MKIKSTAFVISNTEVSKCPNSPLPEYAFIGRSNVGKSSLINAITQRKDLAKTSSRPGKTQLINHFLINENWHLVDLPGYGYAKVSKSKKKVFQKFITQYFKKREQLVSAFLLIDIRHEPQAIDLGFMEWLGQNAIPFSIVFTKSDKLSDKGIAKNVADYKTQLLASVWEELPPIFVTSAARQIGGEEILEYIDALNQMYAEEMKKSF
ncbi:MAG: YihA family ribosome biogenesis GTP-binding protein [Flavobacteriaceae bacterium]|jgi:GTP-binding protein|nr:YihA family ribosome biogenesis GTP-binding protein [Flavobacteriaceae bacterium]MDA8900496.1 ribosome biogenesis GTP-binding protein YihA/YsxC [Flavobacteriaceae bacterium]